MTKKRAQPTEKEAAPSYHSSAGSLDDASGALAEARSLADVLAVVYALEPSKRAALHEAIAEARTRILNPRE